jgi:hypothetical protein
MEIIGLIPSLQAMPPGIFQHLFPDGFSLSHDDGVTVLQGLFRVQGDVEAAHDDWNVAATKFLGNLKTPFGSGTGSCYTHQIVASMKWYETKPVVGKFHGNVFRGETG